MSETSLPHLNGASYLYSASGEYDDRYPVGVEHEASQRVIAELGRISQKFANIPHDETGLNVNRVNGFFARYGLVGKTFVGVDEDGQQAVNEIMGFGRGPTITIASHLPLPDVTYVLRGSCETANGPIATEAEAVHEVSHANQPYLEIFIYNRNTGDDIGYRILRNGFASHSGEHKNGDYFEEGFAGLMEHRYIIEELGLPNGFLNMTRPHELDLGSATYLLPGSYLSRSSIDGWVKWAPSAHAAYGMQLLIARDPAIFSAMLAARKSTDGLDEFIDRINALNPGLYDSLCGHPNEEEKLRAATYDIIQKLYDGNQEKALAVALEQDSRELIMA